MWSLCGHITVAAIGASLLDLDHLLYVGPDLDELMRHLTTASGLSAEIGGRHPGQGTHNAVLGLGPDSYLELMAPDPLQQDDPAPAPSSPPSSAATVVGLEDGGAAPPGTFLRSIYYATRPQVFTWCAKAASSAGCAAVARSLGLDVTVYQGSRVTPSGATLRWDLVIVDGHALGGLVPFFIDWHDSPHPAKTLRAGRQADGLVLQALELRHPDAAALTRLLRALAACGHEAAGLSPITIAEAVQPAIVAKLNGPRGSFELTGSGGQLVTRQA